jgi:hypothetical protein
VKQISEEDISNWVNTQYQIIWSEKTIEDALADDDWLHTDTMTTKQYEEFQEYTLNYLIKTLKYPKSMAKRNVQRIMLNYSLKIKD